MAYGTIKVDTVTFTNDGVDKSVTLSGLVQNPTFSGNITVTGTVSGNTIQGQTVSGVTVTGNAGAFTTLTGGVTTITSGVFAAGSAANPSISFTSDPDTGLYSPGANSVALSTNGTGRLFVDATGKVTVNQATDGVPSINIESDNDGRSRTILRFTDTDVATAANQPLGVIQFFGSDTSGAGAGIKSTIGAYSESANGDSYLTFSTATSALNNQERLRITSTGLVGIGTSSPAKNLHISSGGNTALRIADTGTAPTTFGQTNGGIELVGGNANTSAKYMPGIKFGSTDSAFTTTSPKFAAAITAEATEAYDADTDGGMSLAFWTTPNDPGTSGNLQQRLTILNSGNVGIGTTSPGALFDLAANNDAATGTTANNTFRFTDLDTNTAADQPIGKIEWYSADTSSPGARAVSYILSAAAGANSGGDIRFGVSANAGSASEAARIDSSGRLLVGTVNASNNIRLAQKLAIVNANSSSSSHTGINITNYSNQAGVAPIIDIKKSRSNTDGGTDVVQSGDALGYLVFQGTDGSQFQRAAEITAFVDAAPAYAATALVNGQTYRIVTVGTTDFTLIGASANTVGTVFTATGPGTGTGTAILNAGNMPGRLVFSTTADGASSPTERMRIGNVGDSAVYANNGRTTLTASTAGAADTTSVLFRGRHSATGTTDGTACFYVYANGNVENTNNSYGAISDLKLKENIVDANSQWSDIKALQVRKYNFKEGQTHTQIGLIAQEVELVSPGLVGESPDYDAEGNDLGTVTKSVNYSVLYMKAVKALQEAMERIETLEASNTDLLARVSALESA